MKTIKIVYKIKILRSQQRIIFSSVNVFTEEVNKIALNDNNDERLKFNKVKLYGYADDIFLLIQSFLLDSALRLLICFPITFLHQVTKKNNFWKHRP